MDNEINDTKKKQQINIDIQNHESVIACFNELKQDLALFKKEINYASKALDTKANETGTKLSISLNELENTIIKLDSIFKEQSNQEQTFINELSTFTLLPEKLSNRIGKIVPQIAEELADIMSKSINPAAEQFVLMQKQIEACLTSQQEKLNHLTTKLTEEAILASASNWKKFLFGLLITGIFVVGVSSLTSYLVTTKYPRFIEINGSRDVIVHNSHLKILDKKLKE